PRARAVRRAAGLLCPVNLGLVFPASILGGVGHYSQYVRADTPPLPGRAPGPPQPTAATAGAGAPRRPPPTHTTAALHAVRPRGLHPPPATRSPTALCPRCTKRAHPPVSGTPGPDYCRGRDVPA